MSREVFIKKLTAIGNIAGDYIMAGVLICFCVFMMVMFGKILEPLWPITSLLFWGALTIHGLNRGRQNAGFIIAGLALYGLSWPIGYQFGMPAALVAFIIAFMIYMVGVFFQEPLRLKMASA